MAPEKSPAFQFYPKDFMTDSHVMAMTLPERGAYITLLCLCWLERSLPVDLAALARLCRVSQTTFTRLWPALEPCFTVVDGRLVQGRIERERRKQDQYRAMKSAAGKQGGRPKAQVKQTESTGKANESPPSSSSSSSSSSDSSQRDPPPHARGKRPLFVGQRLTVFDWQLDNFTQILGPYTDAFDLHEWFFALDLAMTKANQVIPKRDGGAWLESQLLAECRRRELPIAHSEVLGKQTSRLAAALSNIKAGAM